MQIGIMSPDLNEIRDEFYNHLFKEKIILKIVTEVFDDKDIEQLENKTKNLKDPDISKFFASIYYRQAGERSFRFRKISV